jgi:transposase
MTMTAAAMFARAHDGDVGDDDPAAKPRRRRFTVEYKMRILAEYDALADPGAKGALLRREGLYTSHLAEWRRALGAVRRLEPKSRSRRSLEQVELERARRRIERLEDQLAKHRLALEIQGKASELLERLLAESDEDKRQP